MTLPLIKPLTQTFVIHPDKVDNQEGCFVTKLDLFFKSKDSNFGATVEIVTTENNVPTDDAIPYSRVRIPSSSINTSNTAATATTATFESPVFLYSGQKYAFRVTPEGNSPEYILWTAKKGDVDVANNSVQIKQDWGDGELFVASNSDEWKPLVDEDLKFKLYIAEFTQTAGSVTLNNSDSEYMTVSNVNGTFLQGEKIFKYNTSANIAGNLTFTNTSSNLIGVGTSFTTTLTANAWLVLTNANNSTTPTDFDIVQIASVTNNTVATIKGYPKFSANTVTAQKTPIGTLGFITLESDYVIVDDSTAANATFKFANTDNLIGEQSLANLLITEVMNINIDYFQPMLLKTSVSGTNISGQYKFANSTLNLQSYEPFKFNDTNYITKYEGYVASKSNEFSSGKTFLANVYFESGSQYTSPVLDLNPSNLLYYRNEINNDSTGEQGPQGNATCKYVSKIINLKDGLEAEDLKVYITAYKPVGTEIEIYARILNSLDYQNIDDKTWAKLELVGDNTYSDSVNRDDKIEYEYQFAAVPNTTILTGAISVNTSSSTMTGANTAFTTELAVNDVIKINNTTEADYQVAMVTAIANNTSATLSSNGEFTINGTTAEVFEYNGHPFKNPWNDNIIRYYGTSAYDTYKQFVLKIVLKSDSTNISPRVDDIRAIALSI